jgi:hypothetical protein
MGLMQQGDSAIASSSSHHNLSLSKGEEMEEHFFTGLASQGWQGALRELAFGYALSGMQYGP